MKHIYISDSDLRGIPSNNGVLAESSLYKSEMLLNDQFDQIAELIYALDEQNDYLARGISLNVYSKAAKIEYLHRILSEKDRQTALHTQRVSSLCRSCAMGMGLSEESVAQVADAGLLHDIGKVGVTYSLINKQSALDIDEKTMMRMHPIYGKNILLAVNDLEYEAKIVEQHHEKWDGSGYPYRLKGEQIDLKSTILSVCDSYDAMVSKRSYNSVLTPAEARVELLKKSGTQFNPSVRN